MSSPRPLPHRLQHLRVVASNPAARSALRGGQMSRPNGFGAHGFGPRLGTRAQPELTRAAFLAWWSGLVLRRCGSAHDIAMRFNCTEQTGRNWMEGASCPTGLQVMRAQGWWPEDFGQAPARMRRAA